MNAPTIFYALSALAGIGWGTLMILSPYWKGTDKFVIGVVVVMMALVYTVLNFSHIADVGGPAAFMTFEGVVRIFSNPFLVDAAWAHILAADLMIGIWMKNNARKINLPYWIVITVQLLTIMFAPLGVLVYLFLHWRKTNHEIADIS